MNAEEWNDVQCPETMGLGGEGLDEVQCEKRINHPGRCAYLMEWEPYQHFPLGPREPLSNRLDRLHMMHPNARIDTLVMQAMVSFMPTLEDQIFTSKPILWKVR